MREPVERKEHVGVMHVKGRSVTPTELRARKGYVRKPKQHPVVANLITNWEKELSELGALWHANLISDTDYTERRRRLTSAIDMLKYDISFRKG